MQPDERLDALLAARSGAGGVQPSAGASGALAPLLEAADRLDALRAAEPDPTFSRALETRLLAHAEALTTGDSLARGPAKANLVPTPPARATQRANALDGRRTDSGPPAHSGRRWVSRTRLLWPAAAAALALVIGGGALTAAAHALPGSPLFGVRQLEQNVQVGLAGSAADRVRLHLTYADDALTALDMVVARHSGDPAYTDALNTLREEDAAAASGVAGLPAGSERDGLAAQLDALRTREREDLRIALATLGWPDRITTTTALGQAGATVPRVTSATVGHVASSGSGSSDESDGHRWQVIVQGTGFQLGAVLLVNGAPAGTVTSVSPTELQAEVADTGLAGSIGVGNPDGTAAVTTRVSQQGRSQSTPGAGAQATATPSHDRGTGGGGDGGHGEGHGATPTPASSRSPGAGG